MVVLDTDIIVAFLRGQDDVVKKIRELYENGIPISTASITAFELFKGAYGSTHPEKKADDIEILLEDLNILYFDMKSSRIAGKIYSQLKKEGKLIDILDQFIASIAIANNEKIITRNVKHFSHISNVTIDKW